MYIYLNYLLSKYVHVVLAMEGGERHTQRARHSFVVCRTGAAG